MNVGSLFSGIGGFDLGLERAGMRTVWFCEQDDYCRRVLARHWPGVPCYADVRSLVADAAGDRREQGDENNRGRDSGTSPRSEYRPGGGDEGEGLLPVRVPPVDVLCGGFPCQDLSLAGRGAGIEGSRSGLWSEYARLIGELRPRYVIVENVTALLARGFGRVLGDLAALGYDAEWDCIPASAFGAPHRRDRVWIVAYPSRLPEAGIQAPAGTERERARAGGESSRASELAYPANERHERTRPARNGRFGFTDGGGGGGGWWEVEPNVGRVANGVPSRVDRLRSLGNALLPQIAEWIGWRVMEYERHRH